MKARRRRVKEKKRGKRRSPVVELASGDGRKRREMDGWGKMGSSAFVRMYFLLGAEGEMEIGGRHIFSWVPGGEKSGDSCCTPFLYARRRKALSVTSLASRAAPAKTPPSATADTRCRNLCQMRGERKGPRDDGRPQARLKEKKKGLALDPSKRLGLAWLSGRVHSTASKENPYSATAQSECQERPCRGANGTSPSKFFPFFFHCLHRPPPLGNRRDDVSQGLGAPEAQLASRHPGNAAGLFVHV